MWLIQSVQPSDMCLYHLLTLERNPWQCKGELEASRTSSLTRRPLARWVAWWARCPRRSSRRSARRWTAPTLAPRARLMMGRINIMLFKIHLQWYSVNMPFFIAIQSVSCEGVIIMWPSFMLQWVNNVRASSSWMTLCSKGYSFYSGSRAIAAQAKTLYSAQVHGNHGMGLVTLSSIWFGL